MLEVYVHVGDVCVHVVLSGDLANVSGQALELGGPVTRGGHLEGPLAGAVCWVCVELLWGPGSEPACRPLDCAESPLLPDASLLQGTTIQQ